VKMPENERRFNFQHRLAVCGELCSFRCETRTHAAFTAQSFRSVFEFIRSVFVMHHHEVCIPRAPTRFGEVGTHRSHKLIQQYSHQQRLFQPAQLKQKKNSTAHPYIVAKAFAMLKAACVSHIGMNKTHLQTASRC
jgi:hypothetical protein